MSNVCCRPPAAVAPAPIPAEPELALLTSPPPPPLAPPGAVVGEVERSPIGPLLLLLLAATGVVEEEEGVVEAAAAVVGGGGVAPIGFERMVCVVVGETSLMEFEGVREPCCCCWLDELVGIRASCAAFAAVAVVDDLDRDGPRAAPPPPPPAPFRSASAALAEDADGGAAESAPAGGFLSAAACCAAAAACACAFLLAFLSLDAELPIEERAIHFEPAALPSSICVRALVQYSGFTLQGDGRA
jgi:hypothetical protein